MPVSPRDVAGDAGRELSSSSGFLTLPPFSRWSVRSAAPQVAAARTVGLNCSGDVGREGNNSSVISSSISCEHHSRESLKIVRVESRQPHATSPCQRAETTRLWIEGIPGASWRAGPDSVMPFCSSAHFLLRPRTWSRILPFPLSATPRESDSRIDNI